MFKTLLRHYAKLASVLNVKVLLVGAFNQEKALVGAFSVIVQLHRLIVYSTTGGWGLHATQSNWGRLHTKLTLSLELVGMQS